MFTFRRSPLLAATLLASLFSACAGSDGTAGAASLVVLLGEPAGANCQHGGTKVASGVDANANGTLEAGEVSATQYVCNGDPGASGLKSLVATSVEPAGTNCQYGGTRVASGIDADASGTLDAAEVSATQYVCSGAPGASGATSLIATTVEPAGANCQHGGTKVTSGLDADADGSLDAGEVSATRYVCDGAPGVDGASSLIATRVEPAGSNCPSGGLRIDSGPDLDADQVLDPGEIAVSTFLCNPDTTPPAVVAFTPPPGAMVPPDARFCVRFSEPIDAATLDESNLLLSNLMTQEPVLVESSYDPATRTACVTPTNLLEIGMGYGLVVGGLGTPITDLAGNPLAGQGQADYFVDAIVAAPNLRVTIDSVTAGAATIDLTYTVWNDGSLAAGPFQLGLFVDPASTPTVGATPDLAVAFASGLAAYSAATGSVTLGGTADSIAAAFVDLGGAVAESNEGDNRGTYLPPSAIPAMTGSPIVSPSTVEAGLAFQVTVPVSAGARYVEVYIGADLQSGIFEPVGEAIGNFAGEGAITATVVAPASGWLGPWTLWIVVADEAMSVGHGYALDSGTSDTTYSAFDLFGGSATDTGFPLSHVTITPSSRPNLTVTVDSVVVGAATIDVGYTVHNSGVGDAGPFEVGLFLDPAAPPGVGSTPDATASVGALPTGASVSLVRTFPGTTSTAVSIYVDVGDTVAELSETDNLAQFVPADPGLVMTGSPSVAEPVVIEGSPLEITVPVGAAVRVVDLFLGRDFGADPMAYLPLGTFSGNAAGEGFISGVAAAPIGSAGDWAVWACVSDGVGPYARCYLAWSSVAPGAYAAWDQVEAPVDSGIPLSIVTIVPSTALPPPVATFTSADVPVSIPDPNPGLVVVTSALVVAGGPATVGTMSVTLDITHPYVSDLTITLISPAGTRVVLAGDVGLDGDNFLSTTFFDAAANPITAASPPFSGVFGPVEPLAALASELSAGTWTLEMVDAFEPDLGVLNAWSISFY